MPKHACTPAQTGYTANPQALCTQGGLPHTGFDLGLPLVIAAFMVALGIGIRRLAPR